MLKTSKHKIAKRTTIYIVAGAVCLALSVLIGIYFGTVSSFSLVLSLLCLFLAIGFFTAEIFARTRYDYENQLEVNKADETYFEDAEVIPVFSVEKMLHSATDASIMNSQTTDPEIENSSAIFLESKSDFLNLVKEFLIFAEERGCKIDENTARSLFASLASSRIIVIREMPTEDFELLVSILSEYFDTQAHIDHVNGNYADVGSLLFGDGGRNPQKPLMLTIEAAQAQTQKLHFIGLADVVASNIENCFLPFINYARVPEAAHFISTTVDGVVDKFYLPENLWIILKLAEGERVTSLPETLLEVCSINDISVSACNKAEHHTQVEMISYPQMKFMIDKLKCCIFESEWKKLDAFVAFLNKYVPFVISNKQWIGMEKYIAVLNSCGKNATYALDEAISARIIPSVVTKASKAEKRVDIVAGLSTSFADNEISISRKSVKSFSKLDFYR